MARLTEEEAHRRFVARHEAQVEFSNLAMRYKRLRAEGLTAQAITLAWLLLGDKMWEESEDAVQEK